MFRLTRIPVCIGVVLFTIFFFAGCRKEIVNGDDTYFGSKVVILGHSGMGNTYYMPSNSYESVSAAISIGCDGSEIDVQLTRDSVLVAFHDEELSTSTDGNGRVINRDLAYVANCRYKLAVEPVFVCTMDDMLARIQNRGDLYFSLDVKLESGLPDQQAYEYRLMRAIKQLCDKYHMESHIFIEGPAGFLDKAKELGMKNMLFLFTNDEPDPAGMARGRYAGILHDIDLSTEQIQKAHEYGLFVMLCDPDDPEQNDEALGKQPDILQTDDPRSVLKALNRYNYEDAVP